MTAFRIHEAGDSALLVELDDAIDAQVNARSIAVAAAIRAANVTGVRDVVPAIRSVGVYFDPLAVEQDRLRSVVERVRDEEGAAFEGTRIEVPVAYGREFGPDLPAVAAFAGVPEERVVDLHAGREYRVFMLGFLPGFPYLGQVDERIAAPRHSTPRRRVPAGSVGIAGRQTGIYPRDSPGGWQIVGRTPLTLFDPARIPAALLAPGDTVRFVPNGADGVSAPAAPSGSRERRAVKVANATAAKEAAAATVRRVTVVRPGLLTTIQDTGRWGHQATGVPVAGPLDPLSHRLANALVGNARHAATLEITLAGPELRFEDEAQIAVAGADLEPTLDDTPLRMNEAVACRAGSVLRFGTRRWGARSYLAFDGGVLAAPVLGSRATHIVSGLGGLDGRALRAGDTIPLGLPRPVNHRRAVLDRPRTGPTATLRVLPGPHSGLSSAMDVLVSARFEIATDSDRMGYRLAGQRLPGAPGGTMISGPTFTGAIQVPPSGEPVLLMADRQTTGGYPQLATVISADLSVAGQLAPGDDVRFALCSRREALAALVRQEGMLLALE